MRDNGIGIPKAELKNLFQPFFWAKNVGAIPGTGLGLAIVKNSVELHQGKLVVNSLEGEGTTFRVILPVHQTIVPDSAIFV